MQQIDEDRSLQTLDGNKELLLQLAQIFCEDAPILLQNLREALAVNDAIASRRAAHSLKGLASTFFAKETTEAAQQVESLCVTEDLENARSLYRIKLVDCVQRLLAEMKDRQWID